MFIYYVSSFFRAPTRRSLRIANLPLNETVPTKKDLHKSYELRSLDVSINYNADEGGSESSKMSGKSLKFR